MSVLKGEYREKVYNFFATFAKYGEIYRMDRYGMNIFKRKKGIKRIFLDYASATPVAPDVLKAMKPFWATSFANPSSLYKEGVVARRALQEARSAVAKSLKANLDEIIFTSSGTESINLAIRGAVGALDASDVRPHIIISATEHSAVRATALDLESQGLADVTELPVDAEGTISLRDLAKALTPHTVLVSVMYANNEIGTIAPLRDIAKEVRRARKENVFGSSYPLFYTDASQAALFLNLNVLQLGVDMMTLDGAKMYGLKGVGALYVRRGVSIKAQITGGGQERGLRSGTENIPLIVGFAKALTIADSRREKDSIRMKALCEYAFTRIEKAFPQAIVNGSRHNRLPNNINICFPGSDSEYTVIQLDARGIQCSSSSSCKTLEGDSSSHVVRALEGKKDCQNSSVRFSLGRDTTQKHIDKLVKTLEEIHW